MLENVVQLVASKAGSALWGQKIIGSLCLFILFPELFVFSSSFKRYFLKSIKIAISDCPTYGPTEIVMTLLVGGILRVLKA